MVGWLTGISIAGFFVSWGMSCGMRPRRLEERAGRGGVMRWRVGIFVVALCGAAMAAGFAWPAWLVGQWMDPDSRTSSSLVAPLNACIFGLGGAMTSGGFTALLADSLVDEKTKAKAK